MSALATSRSVLVRNDAIDVLIIICGSEKFGLPMASVRTIFVMDNLTPVPKAPPEILGLMNLRGEIVTVVSLNRMLGNGDMDASGPMLTAEPETGRKPKGAQVICIEHKRHLFGLLVDSVGDLMTLHESEKMGGMSHIPLHRARLSPAAYKTADGVLPVLDTNLIFDFSRRKAQES